MKSPFSLPVQIPCGDHAGAFGAVRKHDIHTGVDLYAPHGTPVFAMEPGVVVALIYDFTGEWAGSPWWNSTGAVMVEDGSGVWLYGEIQPSEALKVGMKVDCADTLGYVQTVLKVDKGAPMSMLHVERYTRGSSAPINVWSLGMLKPEKLIDPTGMLAGIDYGL
jgi:hypothetical protein